VLKSIRDVYRKGGEEGSLLRELSAKLTEGVCGALLRPQLTLRRFSFSTEINYDIIILSSGQGAIPDRR